MNVWERLLNFLSPTARARKYMLEQAEEESAEITQFVQRVPGVIIVQSVKTKEQGHYVVAEVVIHVNPKITVMQGQEIARRVKLLLQHRFHHLTEVLVHVEPYDGGYPYNMNYEPNDEQAPTLLQ
ncbi:cation transporter dimerization domain-containing protein [Paenibacillus yanchengensis]|uniref:Cation transporter dimerization domain-containing protein n=1 Tax=Paenibacillus yanchengensis TaxID=2035833 RepID=A0ABW4YLP8_9BACL